MCSVHRTNNRLDRRSERGFVLIAALMAVMIITAVGFFLLTTTTQDIRISSRLVGERKALSAAESGVQHFCIIFNPGMPAITNQPVDSLNDPTARFDISAARHNVALPSIPAYGFSESMEYGVYTTTITGRDTAYNSNVSISVGVTNGPNPLGTKYK